MAILTPDYERLQNGQTIDFDMTQEYRTDFKNQNISAAQALITSANDYLVMKASELNDLCDTILYMEQFWEDDKDTFAEKYFRLTNAPSAYSTSKTYNVGDLVTHSGDSYICISDNTAGTWDVSKWAKIGSDDIGLDFVGERPSTPTANQVYVSYDATNGRLVWQYGDNSVTIGYTYPNIRYLTSGDTPYGNEVYMIDVSGGGA